MVKRVVLDVVLAAGLPLFAARACVAQQAARFVAAVPATDSVATCATRPPEVLLADERERRAGRAESMKEYLYICEP